MSIRRPIMAFGAISAILLAIVPASAGDDTAVLAANAGFYAALNTMFTGDIAPMNAVWSHADDVLFMGPNGLSERGWSVISKDWNAVAAMKLGGTVQPIDIHVIAGQNLAVVTDTEKGENTNAKGKTAEVRLRATNIFRMEDGTWKMVLHHTDLLPYLSK